MVVYKDIKRDGQYWVMPNGDRYFDDGIDAGFMVCLLVDVANGVTDASVHPCLWRVQE